MNTILSPTGLRITGTHQEQTILPREYIDLVKNHYECLSEVIFPQLPSCDGRVNLLAKLIGTGIGEAMYILNYLYNSLGVEGDVCEFGVAQGATSALLANEIHTTKKKLMAV